MLVEIKYNNVILQKTFADYLGFTYSSHKAYHLLMPFTIHERDLTKHKMPCLETIFLIPRPVSCQSFFSRACICFFIFRWKQNLSEKRCSFYHLNHFSIQQITYLCRELSRVTYNRRLPDQVYTLLSLIKPDISHDEIVRCLGEATEDEDKKDEAEETGKRIAFHRDTGTSVGQGGRGRKKLEGNGNL